MEKILLTEGKIALVDDSDFANLNQYKWQARKKRNDVWYAIRKIRINKKVVTVFMHRQILGLKRGDGIMTDHRNRNGLDNQKKNLRPCTNRQNQQNQKSRIDDNSILKGVSWHKTGRKWVVYIQYRKRHNLGLFDDKIEAARVYDKAALKYFGEFARLNFPQMQLRKLD